MYRVCDSERRRGLGGGNTTRFRRPANARQRDRRVADVRPSVPHRLAAAAGPPAAALAVSRRPG